MKSFGRLRVFSRLRRFWPHWRAGVVVPASKTTALLSLVLPTLFCTAPAGFAAVTAAKHGPQTGTASWHAPARHSAESRTASGKRWVTTELVAAHRHLPLGSRVAVTHLRNGRSVVVQIIDRGPYIGGRIIDLSQAAAREIGLMGAGTGRVRLEVLPPPDAASSRAKKTFVAHVTIVRAPRK